jgi:hypothetical protein
MAKRKESTSLAVAASTMLLLTWGCSAQRPPEADLAQAELAVQRAVESTAPQQSPVELNNARNKLQGAREALRNGKDEKARFLADEAEVDARLAETRAQAADERRTADEAKQTIDTLRQEALRGTSSQTSAGPEQQR